MDEWEKIRNRIQSLTSLETAGAGGLKDASAEDYWKRKYQEEKEFLEEKLSRITGEDRLRSEKERFMDEQVKQLTAQLQALEQRMSWEKLLSEERFKLRGLEAENEKRKAQYEAQIKVLEEEISGLKSSLRQAQELYDEEKAARRRVETEGKLIEQEYRAFLAQSKAVAAPDDSKRVRELENDRWMLEKRIHELEGRPAGGNPQAEKELAALKEEHARALALFEQKEKDQSFSMEDIARGFAHKVRNYLGIMSGTLQLSLCNHKLDEELKGQITTVDESAQEMLKVIEEYLLLTKMPQMDLQATEISALVGGAVELAEPQARTLGVAVKTEVPAGLPALACDAPSLKEAIRQVIDNAVEASANGSSVTVRARFDEPAHSVVVEVVDTGKGIGENHFKKVYQPFFTNKKDKRGMGLSFAKRTVEHHHGLISFVSAKGKGSTFTLSFPAGKKA